jgi:YggT family protein
VAIIAFRPRPRAMFYQIPSFLLDVIVGLLGGACLLRL